MTYARLGVRIGARLLDLLVMLPFALLFQWLLRSGGAAWLVPYGLAGLSYFVCCHAMWGQTVGKRMTGLRVVRRDGSRVDWTDASLRSSFHAMATIVWCAAMFIAIRNTSALPELVHTHAYVKALAPYMPSWFHAFQVGFGFLVIADIAALLLSRRSRSLHDLVGGTVVIRISPGSDDPVHASGQK